MLDDAKLYRPARRRFQSDSKHRNIVQREPFMYGTLLSDCFPRKRPAVYRERPLQESLVSALVHRKRPPLPRDRPVSRSMVAEFLHQRRERRPEEVEHRPENLFGSKGSSLSRRCKSAPGQTRKEALAARPPTAAASGEFSMIRALINEVLPKEKPEKAAATKAAAAAAGQQKWQKYSAVAKLMKQKLETRAAKMEERDGGVASPRQWPVRPASAPFKLSPQNMSPDVLAETLATKKKNFLRKRPATAPPPRPIFHLPLSRLHNPRKSTTEKNSSSEVKSEVKSEAVKEVVWSESSSSGSHPRPVTAATTPTSSSGDDRRSVTLQSPRWRKKPFESDDGGGDGSSSSTSASSASSSSSSSTTESSSSSSSETETEEGSSSLSSCVELPTPSTLNPDSIDEWLRKKS